MSDPGHSSVTRLDGGDDGSDDLALPRGVQAGSLLDQRYVLIESIGTGGMGQVWRAYDIKLERAVALKFTRTHLRDPRSQQRTIREARAMARLSHDNVLPVYDVVSHDGLLCLVMEYEPGETLRLWLHERKRDPRAIIRHFAAAARGLHAAHVAGFVHRDFKPANVLVGADGRVRVMDFGLVLTGGGAESGDREIGGARVRSDDSLTEAGQVLGTPAYMSPEQRHGEDIDARSDQYSFCVSLYEALFGERPPLPGLATGTGDATADATVSATKPRPRISTAIRRLLRRGLRPDRLDRYPSMAPLIAILEAEATGDSRRRTALAAAAVMAVAGAGWAGVGHLRASAERRACAQEATAIAQDWNPDIAATVATSMLATGADYAVDTHARVAQRLDAYAANWSRLRSDACVAARVDATSSPTLWGAQLACFDERRDAVRVLVAVVSSGGLEVLPTAIDDAARLPRLAECTDEAWLGQQPVLPDEPALRERAIALRQELLEVSMRAEAGLQAEVAARVEALVAEADSIEFLPLRARSRLVQAQVEEARGNLDSARALAEAAYLIAGTAGADGIAAAAANRLVYLVGYTLDSPTESRLWGRLARMHLDRVPLADDPAEPELANNLGLVEGLDGQPDAAVALHERALSGYRSSYGEGHPQVATSLANLGDALSDAGRMDEADAAIEAALEMRQRLLGPSHPSVGWSLNDLSRQHVRRGRLDDAKATARRAVEIIGRARGREHVDTAIATLGLASALHANGELGGALELATRVRPVLEHAFGPEHRDAEHAATLVGLIQLARGDGQAAAETFRSTLALSERRLGPDHPSVARDLQNLATAEAKLEHYDVAVPLMERSVASYARERGETDRDVANMVSNLGTLYGKLGRWPAAIEQFERALRGLEAGEPSPVDLARVLRSLGQAQHKIGELARARESLERSVAVGEASAARAESIAPARFALAKVLWDSGRERAQALSLAREARDAFHAATAPGPEATVTAWIAEHDAADSPPPRGRVRTPGAQMTTTP